jgi:hypothetical protein
LRVFPFAPGETRITEIEFLSPPGYSPELRIGDEVIPGAPGQEKVVIAKSGEHHQSIFVSETAAAKMPQTLRKPFLHFIIDRSASGLDAEDAIASMKEVAANYPEIKEFTITLANYEFFDRTHERMPIALLNDDTMVELIETIPLRGAFLAEQSMQRCLSRFRHRQAGLEAIEDLIRFPILVLVKSPETPEETPKSLPWFRSATPDINGYLLKTHGIPSQDSIGFDGKKLRNAPPARPVLIFASGKSTAVLPVGSAPAIATLNSQEGIEVYDSESGEFLAVTDLSELPADSEYSQAVAVQDQGSEIRWNPSRTDDLLPSVVNKSRETGILTPSTAYIVVENSAQWKMLKKKEKEKLKGNQALDFMEAPEPHLLLVALIFGLFLLLRRRLKRASQDSIRRRPLAAE